MRSNTASRHQKHPPPKTTVCKFSIKTSMLSRAKSSIRAREQSTDEPIALTTPEHKMGSYVISMRAETSTKPRAQRTVSLIQCLRLALLYCAAFLALPLLGYAQVTIAQISDTHLGEAHSPH